MFRSKGIFIKLQLSSHNSQKDRLSFPIEYFPYIASNLVFYGELKQIPIITDEISSDNSLNGKSNRLYFKLTLKGDNTLWIFTIITCLIRYKL